MKAISQFSGKATLWCGVLAASATFAAHGQTLINLGTQGRNIDFSNAPSTRPEKTGPTLPATCLPGELFFELGAPAGQNLYSCVATNTWMLVGGTTLGLSDPGSNGIVVRTAPNTTTAIAAPAGTVVGTTDTQILTNKSLTKSEITDLPTFPNGTIVGTSDTQSLTNKTLDGISPATFGFLDATSSIQTQLNGKQPTVSFTGTGSKAVSATGAATAGHCAQWTSAGDIGDAGAACGTGGTGTSPGGASGQIQYNNAGTFGGLSTIPAANMPVFTGDVTSPAGSTVNTLATVNSTPGTFGSSTTTPVITVNGKGLITAVTTAAVSAGSAPATALASGTLSNLPATCAPGAVYFATDQPAGQQLYTCSVSNIWTQIVTLGPSGALAYTNGSLDIVTSIVPLLTSANTFSGSNSFSNGLQLTTATASQPACNATFRGLFWFQNNGSSKDGLQICVYNGSAYAWASLY